MGKARAQNIWPQKIVFFWGLCWRVLSTRVEMWILFWVNRNSIHATMLYIFVKKQRIYGLEKGCYWWKTCHIGFKPVRRFPLIFGFLSCVQEHETKIQDGNCRWLRVFISAQCMSSNDLSKYNFSCGYYIRSRAILLGDDERSTIGAWQKFGCYCSEYFNSCE